MVMASMTAMALKTTVTMMNPSCMTMLTMMVMTTMYGHCALRHGARCSACGNTVGSGATGVSVGPDRWRITGEEWPEGPGENGRHLPLRDGEGGL